MTADDRLELAANKILEILNTCETKQEKEEILCVIGYTLGCLSTESSNPQWLANQITGMVHEGSHGLLSPSRLVS